MTGLMDELPDESVHLCVTSPPYNVAKEYEQGQTFDDWLKLMRNVFAEVKRVLVPGGRAAIVVANMGRKPYRPLHYYLIGIMINLGYLMTDVPRHQPCREIHFTK
jgi:modification methylase